MSLEYRAGESAPALLPRAHSSELSHPPSVANERPFTHHSLLFDIWGNRCRRFA